LTLYRDAVQSPKNKQVNRNRDCRQDKKHQCGDPEVFVEPRNGKDCYSDAHDHDLYAEGGKDSRLRDVLAAER